MGLGERKQGTMVMAPDSECLSLKLGMDAFR